MQLLPVGDLWDVFKTPGTRAYKLLDSLSLELSRVDSRARTLLEEADPTTTLELITDWERVVEIPDPCQGAPAEDIIDRRNDVIRKLSARGGQSAKFFVDLAAAIDYPITVKDYRQFRAGKSRAGDRCYGNPWRWYFEVSTPEIIIRKFRAGAGHAGDRLATWRNTILECVINEKKPAHTSVIFTYGG